LLFSTGYMANIGAISALVGRGDTVFEDRLNHSSLLDGGLLSGAKFKRYAHADTDHLDALLGDNGVFKNSTSSFSLREKAGMRELKPSIYPPLPLPLPGGEGTFKDSHKLIVTDGVFSMDGDIAPLQALSAVAKQHDAWLMVDDAHGLGVLGNNGGGVLEELELGQEDVQVLVGTLGKALGTFGAFVAGSEELIETLIQKARPYIYTTALPPAIAEATRTSLKIIQTESWRRDKLKKLTEYFRVGAGQLNLPLMASASPIQPLLLGQTEKAVAVSNALFSQGFLVSAIRPPTVPANAARLRVTFSAQHEEHQIDQLLDALAKALA
jgi:8-amino-7-oxononanoate synthase